MKKGSKRSPLSKEQIAHDINMAAKRALIKDKFYPALKEATESVDEAGMLLQATVAVIMEEAMETLRSKRMDEIQERIVKKLSPEGERQTQIENLISVFKGLTLFETRGHFESMRAVLQQMQTDEMRKRNLDTFSPDWERYLTRAQ